MSAAGREMGVSPAVVSKRISMLEERLGARLFQRTTRQLTLTETGEGYFKRIVEILSLVEEADDFVSRRNAQPCGLLKVTAPTAFARLHVMRFLPSFADRYPEIQLEMFITDTFCDLVRDGFDLAVRIGEMPDSSLVARKLCGDKRILCASPRYLALVGEPRSLDELEKLRFVSASSQDIWRLESPDGQVNIRARSHLKTSSGDCARQAVLAGFGVGLRSLWEVAELLNKGELVHLFPEYSGPSHFGIFAVYPSRDFMPAKVHAFMEFLAQHFGGEPSWEGDLSPGKIEDRDVGMQLGLKRGARSGRRSTLSN